MNRRETIEILSAHADQLNEPRASMGGELARIDQVQGLLDLAEQLHSILVPVVPDINFRRRLHGDLILEARRRQTEPRGGVLQQRRRGILIGAAALGSLASVVGVVIAFVLRHRHSRATHVATG